MQRLRRLRPTAAPAQLKAPELPAAQSCCRCRRRAACCWRTRCSEVGRTTMLRCVFCAAACADSGISFHIGKDPTCTFTKACGMVLHESSCESHRPTATSVLNASTIMATGPRSPSACCSCVQAAARQGPTCQARRPSALHARQCSCAGARTSPKAILKLRCQT